MVKSMMIKKPHFPVALVVAVAASFSPVGCDGKRNTGQHGTIGIPSSVNARITSEHRVLITWDDVLASGDQGMDADSYTVFRCDTADGTYIALKEGIVETSFEDDTTEAKYSSFYYKVKAFGGGQESGFSQSVRSDPNELETELLDSTFRIDIETISVTFDFYPDDSRVEGEATLTFRMRPGRTIPAFNFDAATDAKKEGDELISLSLDGDQLDPESSDDLRILDVPGTDQQLLEIPREIGDDQEHTLTLHYILFVPTANAVPFFYTTIWDIGGHGNEHRFPCINSPHELARHQLVFRLHGSTDYHFVGSGRVERDPDPAPGVTQWSLDTEREVPSTTVMFGLLPTSYPGMESRYEEHEINGVNVRLLSIMSMMGPEGIDASNIEYAVEAIEEYLPVLEEDLGPLPTPDLTVVIQSTMDIYWPGVGSMEFFGAVESTLANLRHELFHQYFGCAVIFRTYRDTWLDEAINVWYTEQISSSIQDDFTSDMVSFVSPATNEFNLGAYEVGPEIIQRFATAAGGREAMVAFLRHLYAEHAFEPMNTIDFIRCFKEYTGKELYDEMIRWVYEGSRDY